MTAVNLNYVIGMLLAASQLEVTDYTVTNFVYRGMLGLVKHQGTEIQFGNCAVNGQVSSTFCLTKELRFYVS